MSKCQNRRIGARAFRLMIQSFGISHVGRIRKNNEDRYLEDPGLGLYVVADGMGGASAGERASQITVDTLEQRIRAKGPSAGLADLAEAVQEANRRVRAEARSNSQYFGMGTTVVAVLLRNSTAYVVNVGDSRLYRMSDHSLACITNDHSWVNEVGRNIGLSEEELRTHAYRNMLTRAVGADDNVDAETMQFDFAPDQMLLLSSDGLHGVARDETIAAILNESGTLEEHGEALIDSVLEMGAPDNITAVLISNSSDAQE